MLAVCTRRLYSAGSSSGGSLSSVRTCVSSRGSVVYAPSSALSGVSSKSSLVKVALRKYADAAVSGDAEAATKKWNIELNRLYKLRYYEEAIEKFQKMKEAGVTPNSVTYMIMYDTLGQWQDSNALVALVEEVKARGMKTYFVEKDNRLQELVDDESREAQLEAVDIQSQMLRYKQAGLNPFDPLK